MPIDIECVLEIKESNIWVGTDELNNLSVFANADSDLVFGINKIPSKDSIAGNRGLPSDISYYTNQLLDSFKEFGKKESKFNMFGFSYLSYLDVLNMNMFKHIDESSIWYKIFKLMELQKTKGYKEQNIRIVVWSHW